MTWGFTPSIRQRLTGWYTVVLFLMMVVYATATFVAVRHEFIEQLDEQLHDDFETAEGALTATPGDRAPRSGDRRHDPDSEEGRGSDIWSTGGERIYQSGASPSLPPVGLATPTAPGRFESSGANGPPVGT